MAEKIEGSVGLFFDESGKIAEEVSKQYFEYEKKKKEKEDENQGSPDELPEEEVLDGVERPNIHRLTEGSFEEPDQINQLMINIKEGIDNKNKSIVDYSH